MRNLLLILLVTAMQESRAYMIAVVPKMRAAVGFYGLTEKGCNDRAAAMDNVTCVYTGSWQPNVTENLRIINELIDDPQIDAISLSVLDPIAYTPVINRGVALGKPMITFDSDAPDSNRLAYVGTDNYAMGRELAKLLRQVKPDGGTYGIVSAFGPHNLEERVQGVRDGLVESSWTEVMNSPKDGKEDSDISLDKMKEIVEENPGIGAVVSVVGLPMFKENTTDWKNFVDANRDVLTVIADTLPIQLDLMQTSYVDALVGQLPYNMGFQSAETLVKVLDAVREGVALEQSLPSDVIFGTHQLEVLRIPLQLPPLDFDYNYIGSLAIVGYTLGTIVMGVSVGFMGWTWLLREKQVVRASQPIFLIMICTGTLLMGAAIIPLAIDDEESQRTADIACMCTPWLTNIGFTIAFSALFSKTWRLNQIFQSSSSLRRIKVTEKDVMLPIVVLLTMNTITLTCWTIIAPLKFVRTLEDGTDPWNRPIGSYGQCQSTSDAAGDSTPYLVVIAVVNITAVVVANFQAYRARNVPTDFNESAYIAMANASILQAIVVCVPIVFLTRQNPDAYFIVLSVVLFIVPGAILGCIFVPKILTLKEQRKNKGRRPAMSARTISGLHSGGSLPSNSAGSLPSRLASSGRHVRGDPVTALLQEFQLLSWEDKSVVMKKLGISRNKSDTDRSSGASLVHHQDVRPAIEEQEEESAQPAEKPAEVDEVDAIP